MNSNLEKINQLPILEVLSKLGIAEGTHFKIKGDNIRFKDNGEITDGRIGSIKNKRIYCRSGLKPGRVEGDIVGIIKGFLNIEVSEAIKWAEESFNIKKVSDMQNENKIDLRAKYNSFTDLSDNQIQYLEDRGIKYENIKNIIKSDGDKIVLPIRTPGGNILGLQKRGLSGDKKFRYEIESGIEKADGIFFNIPNKEKKVIFVTEGFTDFLTLSQFGVNTIGLVSALSGLENLKYYSNYELIYIPDKDETGYKSVQKIKDLNIKICVYNIQYDDIGDLNDLWKYCNSELGLNGIEFCKLIYDEADRPETNLQLALKKAIENRDVGSWEIGDKVFDLATGGITPGSLLIINGFTGQGKTTTVDWIIKKLTENHNKKVGYCSMDDDVGKMLSMFLGRKFSKDWRTDIYPNIERYVKEYGIDKFKNFLLYDNIRTIEDFEELIKEEGLNVLIVDYIQIIQGLPGNDKKNQMIYASEQLQILAKKYSVAVICLSQASMSEVTKPVIDRNPNESFMIRATADTFINIGVHNGKHKIGFVKNKYGSTKYKFTEHDTFWEEKSGDIKIFENFDSGTL